MAVSCHKPFLPGTPLEPAVIPTAQDSCFTLQYFPYYVLFFYIYIYVLFIYTACSITVSNTTVMEHAV